VEFLFWSFVGLASLALASFIIVEGGFLIARIYSRSAYWLRYQYPSWRSARQVADLKRRYSHRGKSPRLGALRFTKHRASSFDGPPDSHGEE